MAYKIEYKWLPGANRYQGGNNMVKGFCAHHAGGTNIESVYNTLKANGTSTHFAISGKRVIQYVPTNEPTAHAGEHWANSSLISVELVNSTGAPSWGIAEDTISTYCELIADLAHEYGLYPIKRNVNLWGHKDFFATMCPGVAYDRLDEIANRANKIYKEKYMNTKSAKAQQWDIHLGKHQQLVFSKKDSKGYVTIKSKANGKYLAYAGGKTEDGTGVLFFDSTNDDDQKWKRVWVPVGGISYLTIRPKNDETKCVSVAAASAENGAQLCLWTYYGGKEQLWTRVPMATRTHVLINRSSHKALDCDA